MPRPDSDRLDSILAERHSYLRTLIDQPRPKCDLEGELDGSRSTLDRALRDLADANLAVYEDGVWKPTALGRCSYKTRQAYLNQQASLAEASPLLKELSSKGPVDCTFVIGANVYESNPSVPDAIMQTLLDSVEDGQEVSIVTPVVITGFAKEFYERVSSSENYSLDLLLPPNVLEDTRAAFPSLTDELLNDKNVNLHTASIPFNFGLWIVDSTEAGMIVFTNQGVRGILVNDTPNALGWATGQYERAKQDADPIFSGTAAE
jgi:predicted transcriptional regulator